MPQLAQELLPKGIKNTNILEKLKLETAIRLAQKKSKESSFEEAKKIYKDILARFPKNKKAIIGIKGLSGKINAKAAQAQEPTQPGLQFVINLYKQGKLSEALTEVAKLLQEFPNSVTLYNIQGAANTGLGMLDAAVKSYKRAISIKPDCAEAFNNIGISYQEKGNLEDAIKAYKKAVSLKPDYAEAFNNMGIAIQAQDRLEEAIRAYKKALLLKPDYAEAYDNVGNVLQVQGKLKQAVDAHSKALAIKPSFPLAFYNLGNALRGQGKLEEAIGAYKKALVIEPNFYTALINMGSTLKEQGKLKDSIEAYTKSLAIKPDAEAYNNLGVALKSQGKLEEAIQVCKKALIIKPNYADAYFNIATIKQEQGKMEDTINAYSKALSINPDYTEAYYNLGNALDGYQAIRPSLRLQVIITSMLEHKFYVRPADISSATISLLKFEPAIKKTIQEYSQGTLCKTFKETISALADLPLLLKLMSVCPLNDIELEKAFTKIRACILFSISELNETLNLVPFQSALALQCFTNEYIYIQNDAESKALQKLEEIVNKDLSNGLQPNAQSILCLASYKALNKYIWCDNLIVTDDTEKTFTRQVVEPKKEDQLKSNIKTLGKITNKVSARVKDQYEESPYPRWVNLGLRLKPTTISDVVDEIDLRLFDHRIIQIKAPDILIAGCGTGQHSIGTAVKFKNSKILAIDLSLSSLAYAKRKTEELKIENIEYINADILDLHKLKRQFHIVESMGVVHHMNDPIQGWKKLSNCLISGGLMRIGLYSELARQDIIKIRDKIKQSGLGTSNKEIKLFRNDLIKSKFEQNNQLIKSGDFYSLSAIRDLLFHVQEYRFTISDIEASLKELGLRFCGFESAKIVQKFKSNNTGLGDQYDLDKWKAHEQINTSTFAGMYQFWCQKIT